MSVARLSAITGYTKRSVADECDTLERARVLSVRTHTNRFYYSLARPDDLNAFIGELPTVRPNWVAILNVSRSLVSLERRAEEVNSRTLPVHVRRTMLEIENDLPELGLDPLSANVQSANLWPAVQKLGSTSLGAWSVGKWPSTGTEIRRLNI